MRPYLDDILKLSNTPGPDSTRLAFDLVLDLASYSYFLEGHPDSRGYGSRPSDEPADVFLCRLFKVRRASDPEWDFTSQLEDLKSQRDAVDDFGIEGFFKRSIKLMEEACSIS